MPTVIQTDPITGKVTATDMSSKEHLDHFHHRMANRPHQHFWCSVCEKIQFLRPSQDPTDCIQYCMDCHIWVGSVLIQDKDTVITEKEKETAKRVNPQLVERNDIKRKNTQKLLESLST